jgi:hypothetical protein
MIVIITIIIQELSGQGHLTHQESGESQEAKRYLQSLSQHPRILSAAEEIGL